MRPSVYSPQMALPPIRSGLAEAWMAPVAALWTTWTPFLNRRSWALS